MTERDRLFRRPGTRLTGPLVLLGVTVLYVAMSQFVLWLDEPANAVAGLWPAAGLTLGALLLLPTRLWSWVMGAVLVGEAGGDLAHGYPLAATLGWTLGNMVEPLVGATLMRVAGNPLGALTPLRQLMRFLGLAVVAGPLVGATIGSLTTVLSQDRSLVDVWPKYLLGDALGVLVVAPVMLAWGTGRRRRRSLWEGVALWAGAMAVTSLVFSDVGGSSVVTMAYLLVPFFTWAALRYGVLAVTPMSLVVGLLGSWLTSSGEGAFANAAGGSGHAVTLLQMFLLVVVSTALVVTALVSDLTDREQVEQELRHQATHDPLTGLPNRAVLAEALERALHRRDGAQVALMVCDVDHFKAVNDTYGHTVGDAVLAEVARRLRASVRAEDLVARISGDEFVILLQDAGRKAVTGVCDRLMDIVSTPLPLASRRLVPSLSVGVARSGPRSTAESLFGSADAALYEAKALGRGRVVHVDGQMRQRARERTALERDIEEALAGSQLHAMFAPQVQPGTGRVVGFEAVPHWQHPERGLLPPDRFLAVVQATSHTGDLFAAVLSQSLAAQQRWRRLPGPTPAVSVDLPAAELAGTSLVETVSLALERAGAPADGLWLEVSEGTVLTEPATRNLGRLQDLGVHLVIDDYGTGRSSMQRLAAHHWQQIKLHGAFVRDLEHDRDVEAVVAATVTMAHGLGIAVVATGVGTARQLERVRDVGCDLVQGDEPSRPLSVAAATAMVAGSTQAPYGAGAAHSTA
jgi:diguanylate cyclase (GGDEF)-like protein